MKILEFANKEIFLNHIIGRIRSNSEKVIQIKQEFHLVLAGGETPKEIYLRFKSIETDWSKWKFWFGDERCLPEGDPLLNSSMTEESLFKYIPVIKENIYRIKSWIGAKEAATEYNSDLAKVPVFDLVLLGLGEDGHTASLFPGNEMGEEQGSPDVLPVFNAPKLPNERVTLSINRLNQSEEVIFVVAGKLKKGIIKKIESGDEFPATKVTGRMKTEIYYLNI